LFSFFSALTSHLCPLAVVTPKKTLDVQLVYKKGVLTRGSLIRMLPYQDCPAEKFRAEVLSQVYFYQNGKPLLPQYEEVCISIEDLQPAQDYMLSFLSPPPDDLGRVQEFPIMNWNDVGDCFSTVLHHEEGNVHFEELHWVYAMPPQRALQTYQLQRKWEDLFGSWVWGRVWINDWNRVSLPLEYLSQDELKDEINKENLRTKKQRSKVTVGRGPKWLHFLGSDNLYTDVWGSIEQVQQLVSLSTKWLQHCVQDPKVENPESCVLQIGDISWFNSKRPDPLGHKTHYRGRCIDLRLFRKDASRYEAYWNRKDDRKGYGFAYDPYLNAKIVDFLIANNMEDILFSDRRTNARWAPRHNDHIHFCIPQ